MLKEFRAFLLRGNVIDLAVAVVIGVAFGAVVTAFIKDLVTPLIAAIFGKPDFSTIYFTVNGSKFLIGDFINVLIAFVLICGAWLIVAGYTSINAVVKAELFPTHIRAMGVALPYAVTVSIFGGTAESIALWFKSIGHERWFYYYLTAVIAVSLLVYVGMRDTKRHSTIRR